MLQDQNLSSSVEDFTKDFLSRVCDEFGKQDIINKLHVSKNKFDSILSTGNADLNTLGKLSECFGVLADNFYDQRLDIESAISYYKGEEILPKKYRLASYSKMRTMSNILEILNKTYLNDYQYYFKRYFQVPTESWLDGNSNISTLLLADLYEKIIELTPAKREELLDIGLATCELNEHTDFAELFRGKTFKGCYEILADGLVRYVEKSYDYKIVYVDEDKAIIRRWLSEQIKDELQVNTYSNYETCLYSTGFAATVPSFGLGNVSKGTKTKCVHKGDPYCEMIIERVKH